MPTLKEFVLARVASFSDVAGLQPVATPALRAMHAYQKFSEEVARIASDTNLSAAGRMNQKLAFARANAHEVARVKRAAAQATAKIAKRKEKLQPAPVDKTDAAAAIVRSEIRSRLFKMPPAQRKITLAGKLDPITCAAILEAPAELTGVTPEQRDAVFTMAVDMANPGALKRLERDSDAVEILRVAATVLAEHVAEGIDLPANAIDDFVNGAVPDQTRLEADADRETDSLAA